MGSRCRLGNVDCSSLPGVLTDRRILIKLLETCRDVNALQNFSWIKFFWISLLPLVRIVLLFFSSKFFPTFLSFRFVSWFPDWILVKSVFSLLDFMLESAIELCPNKVWKGEIYVRMLLIFKQVLHCCQFNFYRSLLTIFPNKTKFVLDTGENNLRNTNCSNIKNFSICQFNHLF